ncbi:retrovirus-related pol polyprotein from transposon TNT 1-94 [Tanacetum coccineum]
MLKDLKYVTSVEKEVDDLKIDDLKSQLENKKTKFSKVDDRLLQEFFSKDFVCVILLSLDDIDEYCDITCKYLEKIEECERLENELPKGNNLLKGNRGYDLYTIALQESSSPSPTSFMAKASPTQACLWHRRLSHLNFDTIKLLSKNDIVKGLPKLKYIKDQLCSSCKIGKAKRSTFKTKTAPSSKGQLHLLHMDLCGPMWVESINGKKYILVIIDDYSRYKWTHFLRSKDETLEVLIYVLKMIQ